MYSLGFYNFINIMLKLLNLKETCWSREKFPPSISVYLIQVLVWIPFGSLQTEDKHLRFLLASIWNEVLGLYP